MTEDKYKKIKEFVTFFMYISTRGGFFEAVEELRKKPFQYEFQNYVATIGLSDINKTGLNTAAGNLRLQPGVFKFINEESYAPFYVLPDEMRLVFDKANEEGLELDNLTSLALREFEDTKILERILSNIRLLCFAFGKETDVFLRPTENKRDMAREVRSVIDVKVEFEEVKSTKARSQRITSGA